MRCTPRTRRLVGIGLVAAGIVHLLVPRLLLRTAAVAYDRVLAVGFEPRSAAPRRVRAVGAALFAAGVAALAAGR